MQQSSRYTIPFFIYVDADVSRLQVRSLELNSGAGAPAGLETHVLRVRAVVSAGMQYERRHGLLISGQGNSDNNYEVCQVAHVYLAPRADRGVVQPRRTGTFIRTAVFFLVLTHRFTPRPEHLPRQDPPLATDRKAAPESRNQGLVRQASCIFSTRSTPRRRARVPPGYVSYM
jgi:hypothetical protein